MENWKGNGSETSARTEKSQTHHGSFREVSMFDSKLRQLRNFCFCQSFTSAVLPHFSSNSPFLSFWPFAERLRVSDRRHRTQADKFASKLVLLWQWLKSASSLKPIWRFGFLSLNVSLWGRGGGGGEGRIVCCLSLHERLGYQSWHGNEMGSQLIGILYHLVTSRGMVTSWEANWLEFCTIWKVFRTACCNHNMYPRRQQLFILSACVT